MENTQNLSVKTVTRVTQSARETGAPDCIRLGKPYREEDFGVLQQMFAHISHLHTRTKAYIDSMADYYGVDHDIIVVECDCRNYTSCMRA